MLEGAGIRSAVCYELAGPYDLLLRIWLPQDGEYDDFQKFQELLMDELEGADLSMCDPFQVSQLARHWIFPPEDGSMPRPSEDALKALTTDEIERVESGEASREELERLEGEYLLADLRASPETTDPHDPGIKFALVVSGDPRLTTRQHKQFLKTLIAKLDEAETVGQRSLYAGSGFGHFLILGRVTNAAFFQLGSDLLDKINETEIHALYNGRTYTHVSIQRDFMVFKESLLRPIGDHADSERHQKRGFLTRRRLFRGRGEPSLDLNAEELFAGRFELKRQLGQGAFSVVYEGYDQFEKRLMAVKVFPASSFDRIRREVAVMRGVQHPNVLQVYWTERADDSLAYIASELVLGTLVQDYIDDPHKRLPDADAVEVVLELLDALIAIHPDETRIAELKSGEMSEDEFAELQSLQDAGFVHRDIKPSNMIRNESGRLKILDFNISSRVGDPILTQSGTPPYQAPDASFESWDVSTDLFAAGVVLYELLTREHPYPDMSPQGNAQPIDPRSFRPNLSPALANFLLKATAATRTQRFTTAKKMQAALASAWRQANLESEAEQVGRRVLDLRVAAGLSTEELADRSGLPPATVEAIEQGAESPTVRAARALAHALDVSLSRLLGEET